MTTRPVPFANLLRLDRRDRAGLEWLKGWARSRITRLKVRRKYLPPGPYSPAEVEVFQALLALEEVAGQLLKLGH